MLLDLLIGLAALSSTVGAVIAILIFRGHRALDAKVDARLKHPVYLHGPVK